jgi:GDP-L-fucose synthase
VSIGDVARCVARAMGFEGRVVFDVSKSDGQFKKTASNLRLRQMLPDFKFVPIEEGIKQVCDWFVEHYDEARK